MIKHTLALAGLALISSGTVLADEAAEQSARKPSATAQQEAPAQVAVHTPENAAPLKASKEVELELHPDARTVYHDNGHFGGD